MIKNSTSKSKSRGARFETEWF